MRNIAVLCNYVLDPNRVGGMDYFYWAFDASCREKGYSVTWFFPNRATHGQYTTLNIISAEHTRIEDCFIQHVKQGSTSYDYVICHFLELCTSFYRDLRSLTKAKIIAVDHNPRPLGGYTWRKKLRKRINGIRYGKYTDIYVAVSEYTRNELIRDFGKGVAGKIKVIYNGIDVARIKTRKHRNTQNPSFLVACHLRESKGIQDLIDAVNGLAEDIKAEVRIDVYGDGPYRSSLEKKIVEYHLQNQIHFKGSTDKLTEIYSTYDYLIHPTHMECFSLGLLESLAANVPVITTPVGGNEEAVKNGINGFIFPAKDSYALSSLIGKVYKGEMRIISDVDSLIRTTFTIENMVSGHMQLLHSCI